MTTPDVDKLIDTITEWSYEIRRNDRSYLSNSDCYSPSFYIKEEERIQKESF